MLAPYAIAKANLTFNFASFVKNIATGRRSNAVVVFDINELKKAEVIANENITPLTVLGNIDISLPEIYLCKFVFSVATAIINPPRKRKIIEFE